jgi:DNA-binding FadR family transcriptional regulator
VCSSDLREFLEARILMETASVRLAARRAGPAEVERLKAHLVRQKEAVEKGDGEVFSALDAEFHTELARVSGNGVLLKFLETIWDLLFRFITEVAKLPGAIEDAFKFHQAVTTALAAHETARAEEVMLNHLIDVAKRLEKHKGIPMAVEALSDLACPSSRPPAGKKPAGGKRASSS